MTNAAAEEHELRPKYSLKKQTPVTTKAAAAKRDAGTRHKQTMLMNEQSFVIHRPPVQSGRLDPQYIAPNSAEWRPSVSYKHSLQDIKTQLTPSEFFRHRLKTAGKEIRAIQRLETRWNRNFEIFTKAAIKVQALFRGFQGREHFKVIKEDLRIVLSKRRGYAAAKEAFLSQNFELAISVCLSAEYPTEDLLLIQMKSQYRSGLYEDCIKSAEVIVGKRMRSLSSARI